MALEDIEAKQKAIAEDAKKLARTKDPDEILKLAEKIKGKAKELEKAANNLAAAITPAGPRNEGGEVRVVLTPDQRKRIAEQTGVGLETLVVDRETAAFATRMPTMQKHLIERLALLQAAKTVEKIEKKKAVEALIKTMEREIPDPVPEVQEIIDQLKKDPEKLEQKCKEIAARQLGKNPDEI